MSNGTNNSSYVLWEGNSPIDGNPVVVIATMHSSNAKTGDMVQISILRSDMSPVEAVKSGGDWSICGDCKHRSPQGSGFHGRTCYVNVFRYPHQVWRSYRGGKYNHINIEKFVKLVKGRRVRFGAYGDPVVIPFAIVDAIASASDGWTGYTHQWNKSQYDAYKRFFMASVDTDAEAMLASNLGWRYFRVSLDARKHDNEVVCPASKERNITQCIRCIACDGVVRGTGRTNIFIQIHGLPTLMATARKKFTT
jgi:hypothetical protein